MKTYRIMIDGQKWFDNSDNSRQIATGQRDDSAIGCLLDYNYF